MRRIVWSIVGIAAVTVGVLGAVSTTANAADNEKFIDASYTETDTAVCVDPIQKQGRLKPTVHTFYNNEGEAIRLSFTGTITMTYTNLVNGNTFSTNSSGPGTVDLATGQEILRGSNGFIITDDGLVATHGR